MSHSWDCPTDYEARRRADSDASFDAREHGSWGPFHRQPYGCDEANESYRREYNYRYEREQEEIASERHAVQQRQAAREQAEYEMQQQWEYDEAERAAEAYYEQALDEMAALEPDPHPNS